MCPAAGVGALQWKGLGGQSRRGKVWHRLGQPVMGPARGQRARARKPLGVRRIGAVSALAADANLESEHARCSPGDSARAPGPSAPGQEAPRPRPRPAPPRGGVCWLCAPSGLQRAEYSVRLALPSECLMSPCCVQWGLSCRVVLSIVCPVHVVERHSGSAVTREAPVTVPCSLSWACALSSPGCGLRVECLGSVSPVTVFAHCRGVFPDAFACSPAAQHEASALSALGPESVFIFFPFY